MKNFKTYLENKGIGNFAYHITSAKNLSSIKKYGLLKNKNPNWRDHFSSHSEKGVFFTTNKRDIVFWMNQYENPVLLRIWYNPDEVVSKDSHAIGGSLDMNNNFFINRNIPPEDIEMWDGKQWTLVDKMQYPIDYSCGHQKKAPDPSSIGNYDLKVQDTYRNKWMDEYPEEERNKILKKGWTWVGSKEEKRRRENRGF